MRKLDLKSYTVEVRDAGGKVITIPYDFKESVIQLMFHPNLRLSGKALLETNIVTEKLMKADKEILLEEEEYNKIKSAIDGFEGFSKNEVELVKRITNCPKIEVKENKK
uniref:Uncharacterized protein n=1 Tax=viral metagenome TaxID=1070528 RepID=A0A6M3LCT3_9ZZZZ